MAGTLLPRDLMGPKRGECANPAVFFDNEKQGVNRIMQTGRLRFRKRPYQPPVDKTALSSTLRQIGEDIHKRNSAAGLSKANQALTDSSLTGPEQARVLSLVADGEFKRGRFKEAAQIHLQAATLSMNHSSLWLRPHIGQVRALLKVPHVDDAVTMARHAVTVAEAKMADFDKQVRLANQELALNGAVVAPPVPPRVSVVATRMGYLFLEEGEPEIAEEFFCRAVKASKGRSCRAYQGLAKGALAKGEYRRAVKWASDSIRYGHFMAKTVSSWSILISARRQQGSWWISERLIKGLDSAPPKLRARTILTIVHELRRNDMRQWRKVAEEWLIREGEGFPIIEAEIRKMLLASAKSEADNSTDKREKAEQLLEIRGLSAKEWLSGAKELVGASLIEGRPIDIYSLLATASILYGQDFAPRLRHSLALSCIKAKRHDLARPLLQENIQQLQSDDRQWGKSIWALARLESLVGDHSAAAGHFHQFFEENSMDVRFRLQAQLLWCQELISAGELDSLLETRTLMSATLSNVQDPDILMNFARQLRFGPDELEDWGEEIFSRAESLALKRFREEDNPSVAISIIFKLARRQVCDFGHCKEVVALWEELTPDKRDWLWSTKSDFWNYLGQVFEAYARTDNLQEAEAFALGFLDDPASPPEGLPPLGIPLARRLVKDNRAEEGLALYERLTRLAPNHSLCAEAWYWLALIAYREDRKDRSKEFATRIRAVQGMRIGLFFEKSLDAKALLLLSDLDPSQVELQATDYTLDYLELQLKALTADLNRIPS